MAIRYDTVNKKYEAPLERSRELVKKRVSDRARAMPKKLLDQLNAWLDQDNLDAVVDLRVTRETGYWGSGGSCIKIHPRCFDAWQEKGSDTMDPPRLTAVLLHELVHFAFGTELDAEFFENLLFARADGAVLPTDEDEEEFKDSHYTGVYVTMNPTTREVTVVGKPETVLGSLPKAAKVTPKTSPHTRKR